MNTKMTIIKWAVIILFVSALPAPLYILGAAIIYFVMFSRVIEIFGTLLPMPKFRTLFRLLKRQYMINKIMKSRTTP